jgi:N-acetyl-anhydromuramyl-L-alanine amidase AmpD
MVGEAPKAKACVLGLSPQKHLYQPCKVLGFHQEEYAEYIALYKIVPTITTDINLEAIKAPADDPPSKNTKNNIISQKKKKEKIVAPTVTNSISAGIIGLSKGSSKKIEIKALQTLLVKLGYMTQTIMNTGPGIFGPQTKKSLIAFQQANNITANGIVNNVTFSLLKIAKPKQTNKTTQPSSSSYVSKEMNYFIDHIPKSKYHRSGRKMTPTTLTIHSTANPNSTAKNERAWLGNPSNKRYASHHLVVDQNNAIECIPLHEVAWHTGTRSGNKTSIGLEICESGNREATLKNAAQLAAKVLHSKGWGINSLKMHYDWSEKNCPRILRSPTSRNKPHQTWDWFTNEVKLLLTKMK